jgi:hypothetical protein
MLETSSVPELLASQEELISLGLVNFEIVIKSKQKLNLDLILVE